MEYISKKSCSIWTVCPCLLQSGKECEEIHGHKVVYISHVLSPARMVQWFDHNGGIQGNLSSLCERNLEGYTVCR